MPLPLGRIGRMTVVIEDLHAMGQHRQVTDVNPLLPADYNIVTHVDHITNIDAPPRFAADDAPNHTVIANFDGFRTILADKAGAKTEPDALAEFRMLLK